MIRYSCLYLRSHWWGSREVFATLNHLPCHRFITRLIGFGKISVLIATNITSEFNSKHTETSKNCVLIGWRALAHQAMLLSLASPHTVLSSIQSWSYSQAPSRLHQGFWRRCKSYIHSAPSPIANAPLFVTAKLYKGRVELIRITRWFWENKKKKWTTKYPRKFHLSRCIYKSCNFIFIFPFSCYFFPLW